MNDEDEKAIRAEADKKIADLKKAEVEARARHFGFIEPMPRKYPNEIQ